MHPGVVHLLAEIRDHNGRLDGLKAYKLTESYAVLAESIATQGNGPELTVALRKLLESLDAAFRSIAPPRKSE